MKKFFILFLFCLCFVLNQNLSAFADEEEAKTPPRKSQTKNFVNIKILLMKTELKKKKFLI